MGLNSAIERTQLDLDTNEGVMVGSEKRGVNDIPLLEAKETRVMRRMFFLSLNLPFTQILTMLPQSTNCLLTCQRNW